MKKRRTAKQIAATKRLVALNKRRASGSTKRRKNPVKRKATTRRVTRRRKSPVRRRRTAARRRNPALNMRSVTSQLKEAGTGAVGALALDVAQGYLPIPAAWKAGIMGTVTKAGIAIGIGLLASKTKLVNYSTAAKMANGALTVVLHDELKKQVGTYAPGIQMGEYMGEYLGEYPGAGYNPGGYLPNVTSQGAFDMHPLSMGEYVGGDEMHEDMGNY